MGTGSANQVVAINLGTVIYQGNPTDEQVEQLVWYLERVGAKMLRLQLGGLSKLDDKGILLPNVYVTMATTSLQEKVRGRLAELHQYGMIANDGHTFTVKPSYNSNSKLPSEAIADWKILPKQQVVFWSALLATEAVQRYQRLVLLGDPGGGKTTFLRYLAWMTVKRGLGQIDTRASVSHGMDELRLLPILLSLPKLAAPLGTQASKERVVSAALADEMEHEYDTDDAATLLSRALKHGAALLLFDGLDEVPLVGIPGETASRSEILQAIRRFAEMYPSARIIITCRTRAFNQACQDVLGWHTETLAPFTLGQIRYFAQGWYNELLDRGVLDRHQSGAQAQTLIWAIENNQKLRIMAATPLLLLMMALVLYERGELPRDRSLLYEQILEQLLGVWDKHRGGKSLSDVIGNGTIGSDDILPLLEKLAYDAHHDALSPDLCGRLPRETLLRELTKAFRTMRINGAAETAERCLDYFDERSGLLVPEDDGEHYVFAHLTLQEYCAGRHMLFARGKDAPADRVMQMRADDRWREPILLGLGAVQRQRDALADRIETILTRLIDRDERGQPKPIDRWYRDLLLVAEIGREREWNRLRLYIDVERLQRDLHGGLMILLQDETSQLLAAERIQAGVLLGDMHDVDLHDLVDLRIPTTPNQWRSELERRNEQFGQPDGYWCYVRSGPYRIGGWEDGELGQNMNMRPFWVARFPITVAQFAPFVAVGYGAAAQRWWSSKGWNWKIKQQRTAPLYWRQALFDRPYQPVIGITWYEATAWASWLSEQLSDRLPIGYGMRLPTEAEWEVAAAYDHQMRRRTFPWGDEHPTPEHAVYRSNNSFSLTHPAAVGCCLAGQAACGALDMAGNIWEWTATSYEHYPKLSGTPQADFTEGNSSVSLRGGSWFTIGRCVRCEERNDDVPEDDQMYLGFRVVLAPI